MKTVIYITTLSVAIPAQAAPLNDADQRGFIAGSMKKCLADATEELKGAVSDGEIFNFCGCFASTMSKTTTVEDMEYTYTNKMVPPDYFKRVREPARDYCLKYLNLPQNTDALKNKKW
jgi:hypothetical protein